MADLVAKLGADTSELQSEIQKAKESVREYKREVDKLGTSNSKQANAIDKARAAINQQSQTYKGAKIQVKKLEESLKDLQYQYNKLDSKGKNSGFGRGLTSTMEEARAKIKSLKSELTSVDNISVGNKASVSMKGLGDAISSVNPKVGNFFSKFTESFPKLSSSVEGFSSKFLGSISSVTTRALGLVGAFVAAVSAAAKKAYDLGDTIGKNNTQTKQFTGNEASAGVDRVNAQGVAEATGEDIAVVMRAATAATKEFGVSWTEATALMQQGQIIGANANGEMLENLREYSTQIARAGFSYQDFIGIMAMSNEQGVFSDKAIDSIKEATLRLTEMPKATQDALESVGIDATTMGEKIRAGVLKPKDAIAVVAKKIASLPDGMEKAKLIAAVFGAAGEDAGVQWVESLANVDKAFAKTKNKMTETQKAQANLADGSSKLKQQWEVLFKPIDKGFESFTNWINNALADFDRFAARCLKGVSITILGEKYVEEAEGASKGNKNANAKSFVQGVIGNLKKVAFNRGSNSEERIREGNRLIDQNIKRYTDEQINAASRGDSQMTTFYSNVVKELKSRRFNESHFGKVTKDTDSPKDTHSSHTSSKEEPWKLELEGQETLQELYSKEDELEEHRKEIGEKNYSNFKKLLEDAKNTRISLMLPEDFDASLSRLDSRQKGKGSLPSDEYGKQRDSLEEGRTLSYYNAGLNEEYLSNIKRTFADASKEYSETVSKAPSFTSTTSKGSENISVYSPLNIPKYLEENSHSWDGRGREEFANKAASQASSKQKEYDSYINNLTTSIKSFEDSLSAYKSNLPKDESKWKPSDQEFVKGIEVKIEDAKERKAKAIDYSNYLDTIVKQFKSVATKERDRYKEVGLTKGDKLWSQAYGLQEAHTSMASKISRKEDSYRKVKAKEANGEKLSKKEIDIKENFEGDLQQYKDLGIEASKAFAKAWDNEAKKSMWEASADSANIIMNNMSNVASVADEWGKLGDTLSAPDVSGWQKFVTIIKLLQSTFNGVLGTMKDIKDVKNLFQKAGVDKEASKAAKSKADLSEMAMGETVDEEIESLTPKPEKKSEDVKVPEVENDEVDLGLGEQVGETKDMAEGLQSVAGAEKELGTTTEQNATKAEGAAKKTGAASQAKTGIVAVEAVANAVKSATELPFPANIAAMAAAAAAVIGLLSAVGAFADGGIVANGSHIGDYNIARVNGGEMILNGSQQARLFSLLNGNSPVGSNGNNTSGNVNFKISGRNLVGTLTNYNKRQSRL